MAKSISWSSNMYIKGRRLSFNKRAGKIIQDNTLWHDAELVRWSECLSLSVDARFEYNRVAAIELVIHTV